MKRKLLRYSNILAVIVFLVVFFGLAIKDTPDSTAIKATDFKAGRIVDDGVFYNSSTMTTAQIQAFMDKTLPACDMWGTGKIGSGYYIRGRAVDPNTTRKEYARRMREEVGDKRYHAPPYVCINKYYENPQTHVSNFDTNGEVKAGMISAAQIIHDASVEYSVNPQVLLVMLKKESYAWGDNWPTKNEFNTVMGYACPDNAACDTKYYGFYNQVNMAAWQLKYYREHIYSYNYRPYATNRVYYSPDYSCGTKSVYIENIATASLYIYTPYTPNDGALRNYPGAATCGSYGNRNFFMYFSEWFGSTIMADEYKKIDEAYERLGGEEKFGAKVGSYGINNKTNIYWQQYEKGYIVGNNQYGYHESSGNIREVWRSFGFEGGKLGFPIGNIETNTNTGIYWQQFQNGYIVGNDKYGYYESTGNIREVWRSFGFEGGKLGFPIGNIETNTNTGIYWQQYQNGYIVGNDKYGYYESTGKIREYWSKTGHESGRLGFPLSNVKTSDNYIYQKYQNGVLYYNTKTNKYSW